MFRQLLKFSMTSIINDAVPMLGICQNRHCFKVECNLLKGNIIEGTTIGMGNDKIIEKTVKEASKYNEYYKVDPPAITHINCDSLCTKCNTVYTHWWKTDKIEIDSKL